MTQRSVEVAIGRLVSDEMLRTLFRRDPDAAIGLLQQHGLEFNVVEIGALARVPARALERLARALAPRLLRASLTPGRRSRRRLAGSADACRSIDSSGDPATAPGRSSRR